MRWSAWLAPVGWVALVTVTSSGVITTVQLADSVVRASGGVVSDDGFRSLWALVWWIMVKGWHLTEFAILFLLCHSATKNPKLSLTIPLLFAVADELHQLFVPDRGCRLSDVAIDWLGVVVAWAMVTCLACGLWTRTRAAIGALAVLTPLAWLSLCPFGLVTLPTEASGAVHP